MLQTKELINNCVITLGCNCQSVSSLCTALSIAKYWYDDCITCKLNAELHQWEWKLIPVQQNKKVENALLKTPIHIFFTENGDSK
jgi:hypothetical protein